MFDSVDTKERNAPVTPRKELIYIVYTLSEVALVRQIQREQDRSIILNSILRRNRSWLTSIYFNDIFYLHSVKCQRSAQDFGGS